MKISDIMSIGYVLLTAERGVAMRYMDRVVVVTGGGEGIGRSIALHYAKEGAKVVVVDKNEHTGRETVDQIYDNKGRGIFLEGNVSKEQDVRIVVENIVQCYGHMDILINNAGVYLQKGMHEATMQDWEWIMDTNLKSAFLCIKESLPYIRRYPRGSIINIASSKTCQSAVGAEIYAASKGGLISMTQNLAKTMKAHGVQINCISPGYIMTMGYERLSSLNRVEATYLTEADVAKLCLEVSDAENHYVNGSNIMIDHDRIRKVIYYT